VYNSQFAKKKSRLQRVSLDTPRWSRRWHTFSKRERETCDQSFLREKATTPRCPPRYHAHSLEKPAACLNIVLIDASRNPTEKEITNLNEGRWEFKVYVRACVNAINKTSREMRMNPFPLIFAACIVVAPSSEMSVKMFPSCWHYSRRQERLRTLWAETAKKTC